MRATLSTSDALDGVILGSLLRQDSLSAAAVLGFLLGALFTAAMGVALAAVLVQDWRWPRYAFQEAAPLVPPAAQPVQPAQPAQPVRPAQPARAQPEVVG